MRARECTSAFARGSSHADIAPREHEEAHAAPTESLSPLQTLSLVCPSVHAVCVYLCELRAQSRDVALHFADVFGG